MIKNTLNTINILTQKGANMAEKKRGLMTRLIEGSEKSEGYARASLPSNRWELFWDIFKGRLGKLFIINLLVLIFLIPLFLLIYLKSSMVSLEAASQPFSQNIGIGYPAIPNLVGLSESVIFQSNFMFYSLLPIASFLFAIGLSGGFYVIRNMVWTEGIFVSNDFWRGIKLNYFIILKISLFYTIILFISSYSLSSVDLIMVTNSAPSWLLYMGKGSTYILILISTIMTLFMCSLSVTYNLSFFKLIRNSFLMTIGLLPTNLFFAFLAILPFLLTMLGSIFTSIGYMFVITIGISTAMLIWTDYSHWAFDKFINDKVPGAQKNRGIYEKINKNDSAAVKQYKMQVEQLSNSSLSNRPIKPITDKDLTLAELPANFSRKHLHLLQESKDRLIKDNEEYIEKHINEPKYKKVEESEIPPEEIKKEKDNKKNKNDK
jgi:hypothetical protein